MFQKRKKDESGAAAVEFALVVPVLLTLIFGIVDFSLAFNYRTQLNNAAIQGARHYVLTGDKTESVAVINSAVPSGPALTADDNVKFFRIAGATETLNEICPAAWVASPRNAIRIQIEVSRPSTTGLFGDFDFKGRGVAACR